MTGPARLEAGSLVPPEWAQAAIDVLRAAGEPARWDPDGEVRSKHGDVRIRIGQHAGLAHIMIYAVGDERLCDLVLEAAREAENHRGLEQGAEPDDCRCCDPACDPEVEA